MKIELKLDEKRNLHNHQSIKQKRKWRNSKMKMDCCQREEEEVAA